MTETVVVKGRLVNPTTVELEEPLDMAACPGELEVTIKARSSDDETRRQNLKRLIEHLRSLPPGTRTHEDIDRQIEEERSSWE
jgi:hypothetical protein